MKIFEEFVDVSTQPRERWRVCKVPPPNWLDVIKRQDDQSMLIEKYATDATANGEPPRDVEDLLWANRHPRCHLYGLLASDRRKSGKPLTGQWRGVLAIQHNPSGRHNLATPLILGVDVADTHPRMNIQGTNYNDPVLTKLAVAFLVYGAFSYGDLRSSRPASVFTRRSEVDQRLQSIGLNLRHVPPNFEKNTDDIDVLLQVHAANKKQNSRLYSPGTTEGVRMIAKTCVANCLGRLDARPTRGFNGYDWYHQQLSEQASIPTTLPFTSEPEALTAQPPGWYREQVGNLTIDWPV